jgi:hypothetical protein
MIIAVELFFVTILQYKAFLKRWLLVTSVVSLPSTHFLSHLLFAVVKLRESTSMRLETLSGL